MNWKPMSDNSFPWPYKDVIIAAFDKDNQSTIELFQCKCAEHGAYFPKNTTMLSIIEQGFIPFAFREDDVPTRDDKLFPPLWSDYLTSEEF